MPSELPPDPPMTPSASDGREAREELGAESDRRLHPLSWLFVMLGSLREFALPLVALLVFGGGRNSWELYGLIGVGFLTLFAVLQYFTYRFRVDGDELIIRSGLLHRNVRNIPLHRIQNVALKRNLLHRALGVAEVRLESAAGGATAEAQMRVLSLADAAALEALVRSSDGRGSHRAVDVGEAPTPAPATELLVLPTPELIKLGLTSNRGLLIATAGFGLASQMQFDGIGEIVVDSARAGYGYAEGLGLGVGTWLLAAVILFSLLVILLRVVSVLLVVLQFHGFTLTETERGLSVESGLLTRTRSNAPRHKIQHWTVNENFVHRIFGRRSLRVETAVLQVLNEDRGLSQLVPIDRPAHLDSLIQRWLPHVEWPDWTWYGLHPRAWRRIMFWPSLFTLLVTAVATARFGHVGLLPLLLLPWWWFRAKKVAECCGFALTDHVLAWRSGWLDRKLSFAEIGKLQAVALLQSPFDRRRGMATLVADTAGASPTGHRLELKYLPLDVAQGLFDELQQRIERTGFRW